MLSKCLVNMVCAWCSTDDHTTLPATLATYILTIAAFFVVVWSPRPCEIGSGRPDAGMHAPLEKR